MKMYIAYINVVLNRYDAHSFTDTLQKYFFVITRVYSISLSVKTKTIEKGLQVIIENT